MPEEKEENRTVTQSEPEIITLQSLVFETQDIQLLETLIGEIPVKYGIGLANLIQQVAYKNRLKILEDRKENKSNTPVENMSKPINNNNKKGKS